MKKILLSFILACSPAVYADNLYLDATVGSKHFCNCEDVVNERNTGLGLTYEFNDKISLNAGYYRNSYARHSEYLFINYKPLQSNFGDFNLSTGLGFGFVSGYQGTNIGDRYHAFGDFSAGVLPNISLTYKPIGARISLFVPNRVIALQISFRIKNYE